MFPKVVVNLDQRHVLAAARRLPVKICSHSRYAEYLSGEIFFSSYLSTSVLFHVYWSEVLQRMVEAGRWRLVAYVKDHVLRWADGSWTASWRCGLDVPCKVIGYGAATCHQALERCNGVLKSTLPVGYEHRGLGTVSDLLECSLRTQMCLLLRHSRQNLTESNGCLFSTFSNFLALEKI